MNIFSTQNIINFLNFLIILAFIRSIIAFIKHSHSENASFFILAIGMISISFTGTYIIDTLFPFSEGKEEVITEVVGTESIVSTEEKIEENISLKDFIFNFLFSESFQIMGSATLMFGAICGWRRISLGMRGSPIIIACGILCFILLVLKIIDTSIQH